MTTVPSRSILDRRANKISATQTYILTHTARGKLSSEASRPDHNLRLLVGHANFLDSLMLGLTEAKQEHETWFNQVVRQASKPTKQRHIQWADAIVEEPEEDWQAEDANSSDSSDSHSDCSSDGEIEEQILSVRPAASYNEIEAFVDDGEEDYEDLALHLTQSHGTSPPHLDFDLGDSSDNDLQLSCPPLDVFPSFGVQQR